MRYMYSPSTLRAPPVLWPARTDARAVLEVLLATTELLEKCWTRHKNAAATLHDDRTPVPPEQVGALGRVCHYNQTHSRYCGFSGAPSALFGIMGHDQPRSR